jgi:hypothetical protein
MSRKCNAPTKKGGLCKNTLACPHHRQHCQEVIASRAKAREIPSQEKDDNVVTSWEEAKRIMNDAHASQQTYKNMRKENICGCF